jgi:hypothetical protein
MAVVSLWSWRDFSESDVVTSSSGTMGCRQCLGPVDVGPIGFPSDVTTNRGPWLGPRAEARRGAASATPTPSRIGQTS